MKSTIQRIALLLILTFMAQMLMGCFNTSTTMPEFSSTAGDNGSQDPNYAFAQATIDSGKSQLLELSRKATQVSLDTTQAANASALSTKDYNQRQKMELDYQATLISLNIAQAAATQEFITQQTKMAEDATALALSDAVTATHSAYIENVAQTAQAQTNLDSQVSQTEQAAAALAAFPLTATPLALTQAALLMQQYDREQQSFLDQVVAPLIPILAALVLLLFILVIILAFRRYISKPWPRRLRIGQGNIDPIPLTMIDGVIADLDPLLPQIIPAELTPANPPRLPEENSLHVEILDATEPPVAHWIAEVEDQLAVKGGS
jgi:hypothetical protein